VDWPNQVNSGVWSNVPDGVISRPGQQRVGLLKLVKGVFMPVVRIVAKYVEGGIVDNNNKFFLLASLDKEFKIIGGEWMGYFITDGKKHPFILDNKGTLWFDQTDEIYSEDTNLLSKTVTIDEIFSFNLNTENECAYKIIAVSQQP
jgi:hypothetical protein